MSKIFTTKNDLKNVIKHGCIECHCTNFLAIDSAKKVICRSCGSEYTFDLLALTNMLEDGSEIRIYTEKKAEIEDPKTDIVVTTSKVKRRVPHQKLHSYK